MQNATAI